jgi:S-adenosylmethionine decarboxylase
LSAAVGRHCIAELYGCCTYKLDDEALIRDEMTEATRLSGATLLNLTTHKFEPQGVTGLALLSESHISIHTWPELNYAAVDCFTCGERTNPEAACNHLKKALGSVKATFRTYDRAIPATAYQSPSTSPCSTSG